jgi:hypothetical protein
MHEPNDAAVNETAPLAVDPLADLLFNMVAIIVIAVIVILPTVDATPGVRAPSGFKLDGRSAQTLVATAAGVRLGAGASQLVALRQVLSDEDLARRLERIRDQGDPLLVLIEPDGMEAAFLLETVVSDHGPVQFHQVRLDRACAFANSEQGRAICPSLGSPAP